MAIQATVLGNLGADAKQVMLGQTPALEFSIASRRSRRDKNNEKVTDWVDVIYFKTGLQQWLTKGRCVQITGELEVNTYQTRMGEWKVGMKIVANTIELAGGPEGGSQEQPVQASQPVQQVQTAAPQQPQFAPPPTSGGSDLPF